MHSFDNIIRETPCKTTYSNLRFFAGTSRTCEYRLVYARDTNNRASERTRHQHEFALHFETQLELAQKICGQHVFLIVSQQNPEQIDKHAECSTAIISDLNEVTDYVKREHLSFTQSTSPTLCYAPSTACTSCVSSTVTVATEDLLLGKFRTVNCTCCPDANQFRRVNCANYQCKANQNEHRDILGTLARVFSFPRTKNAVKYKLQIYRCTSM